MRASEQHEAIRAILETEKRYAREAYLFVLETVSYAAGEQRRQASASPGAEDAPRHISGQELLQIMREFALKQYGPLAHELLSSWGILRSEDFGELVFLLVNHGLLGASKDDSITDFENGFDFREAFLGPYEAPAESPVPTEAIY